MDLIPNPLIIPIGLAVGILVAAPVGPVNVLCIQRAIVRGVLGGVAAGLGAVLGDGLIALLAALGVGAISGAVNRYRDVIQAIGGTALIAFGLKLSLTVPQFDPQAQVKDEWTSIRDYVWDIPKTFLLTVTNPGAVLGLIAIFGGISTFVEVRSTVEALTMVAAVMAGSLLWWVLLSSLVGRIRHLVDRERLRQINAVSGALLTGFGALLISELLFKAVRIAWHTVPLA
jgi:threonine/homoserine/homoserine lactone efflux protein